MLAAAPILAAWARSGARNTPLGRSRLTPARAENVRRSYHEMYYADCVERAISVRLDDETREALRQLEATGMTRSQAIRAAVVAEAARLTEKRTLAAEVAALESDDEDRQEMLAIAEMMEELRAPG